jgi:hypothetical protein
MTWTAARYEERILANIVMQSIICEHEGKLAS